MCVQRSVRVVSCVLYKSFFCKESCSETAVWWPHATVGSSWGILEQILKLITALSFSHLKLSKWAVYGLFSGKSYSQCFANNMCVITRSSVLFEKIYDIRCSFIWQRRLCRSCSCLFNESAFYPKRSILLPFKCFSYGDSCLYDTFPFLSLLTKLQSHQPTTTHTWKNLTQLAIKPSY